MGGVESSSKGSISFKKKGENKKAEVNFTKPKSTIMIKRQKDSEAGVVDKEKGLLDSRRKRWKEKKERKVVGTEMR